MQRARARRKSFFDLRRITIGDWIVVVAGIMTVASLFMPWFVSSIPQPHGESAFAYSEVASVVVIIFFLATLFLVIYPALTSDAGMPPLPFSTHVVFFFMGTLLLLMFAYEAGKYACIQCQGVSRGYGVWVGMVATAVYVIGAIIKYGSAARPTTRRDVRDEDASVSDDIASRPV